MKDNATTLQHPYQAVAARYNMVIEPASDGIPPHIGGAISAYPLKLDEATAMVNALRQLGAEAKITSHGYVYLSGCSFQKGDKLPNFECPECKQIAEEDGDILPPACVRHSGRQ